MASICVDKEWQREMDANTLAEAEQIKNSPSRLKGAKQAAKKIAKEADARTKAMKTVAGGPIVNSNKKTPKTNASKKKR